MRHIIKAALVPSLLAAMVIPADIIAPQLASARSVEPLLTTETVSTSTPDKQTAIEEQTNIKRRFRRGGFRRRGFGRRRFRHHFH